MELRNRIFAAGDRRREEVAVPEWDCTVWVRTLTGADRDTWESSSLEKRGKGREINMRNIRARLLVLCLEDADGKLIFQADDAEELGQKSAVVLARLFQVAQKVNALREEDVEELAKNSVNG